MDTIDAQRLRPRHGAPLDAIAIGSAEDVAPYFAELDAYLEAKGVGPWARARELLWLPSWKQYAVPPREYWPNIVQTLLAVQPMRAAFGPVSIRAYRPPAYNAVAGGAPKSTHQYFAALDLRPVPYSAEGRRDLALRTAELFDAVSQNEDMGFGAYGTNTPSNVHVDTGYKRRTWRDAQLWLQRSRDT